MVEWLCEKHYKMLCKEKGKEFEVKPLSNICNTPCIVCGEIGEFLTSVTKVEMDFVSCQNIGVWIVGKNLGECIHGIVWSLEGICWNEDKAISMCKDENFFIGPVNFNDPLPEKTTTWPGCYYPKGENNG
jgi:hypothetical protein